MGKMKLKKFFIELDNDDTLMRFVGVTAWTEEDALNLIQDNLLKEGLNPSIKSMKEITSLNELDQNHVLPNMGEFASRGIWFPFGFTSKK
ncbi:MAG: hypothetical protein ACFB15_22790 [Cyclobacteriaceae bacterium]